MRKPSSKADSREMLKPDNRIPKLEGILGKLSLDERNYINKLIYQDPFTVLYARALTIYLLILTVFLLLPFDFELPRKNSSRWVASSNGIEFPSTGQILSVSSTKALCDRLVNGKGLSLVTWIKSDAKDQSGPARIVSYSLNTGLRNFTLAQSQGDLVMRLRTVRTDLNGVEPYLRVKNVFDSRALQHLVITYDFSFQSVYINGKIWKREAAPQGRFTNWDPSYHIILGNEATGNRPWKGKIYFVAVYDRPLSEKEVCQSLVNGRRSQPNVKPEDQLSSGLVVRYLFDEGKGNRISDSSGNRNPLNLYIPKYVKGEKKTYLQFPPGYFEAMDWLQHAVLNIMIFIPFGFLVHATLRNRYRASARILVVVFIAGGLYALCVESLQYFSLTRSSDITDLLNNFIGVSLGVATDRCYTALLNKRGTSIGK